MSSDAPITQALSAARQTRQVELGPGALNEVPELFRRHFANAPAVIVADANTFPAAGDRLADLLARADTSCLRPFVFTDPALYAEHRYVEQLEAELRSHDAIPIAVGGGTINDLTKLAAHRVARPYMAV